MKNLRQCVFATFAMWFISSSAIMAFAGDPPSRVARLKYISGDVSMQPGGVDDWAAATINRPMTTADRLWADRDSRAELHLGSAAIRIDSESSLTLSNLTDNTVQLELDEGTLNLQVARMFNGEIYEVDTPNAAFTVLKPGNYRFDVDSSGDSSVVTVWKGKVVATGNGQAVQVDSNHQARFMGGMSLVHAMYHAPRFDGF
ncbi:MAG TPA: FecR domain-containing protein, partial [Terriglobales bacterium]|nr:FecR domain-containing protein [Terriglobales bacterium]